MANPTVQSVGVTDFKRSTLTVNAWFNACSRKMNLWQNILLSLPVNL